LACDLFLVHRKLSERLQRAFYEVIEEKGIDVRLAELAIAHLTSNYQDESVRWLRNVRQFLKKRGKILPTAML
jgi:hypothetical protein